ncbi:MAG: type 4a pilus biogenesis protein PilO [Kofleriaceae bacterium]|nr:type 4a pilus biogenesis protein PilO [Kofleriaceae bacterium]
MASSGFIADFAKKPPQYKAVVFGGIALALGFVYFKFGYSPLKEKLEQGRQDSEQMLSRSKRMDDDLVKFKELRTRMDQLQKVIDENQKVLPSESELPAFFETLNRKVTEAGVEVTKWQRKKEETMGQFIKVPVDVEITGTFFQIKRFMASLVQRDVRPSTSSSDGGPPVNEAHERVVSIEDLSLSDPKVKNREIVMVAKFVASTYRQEDKTGAAAGMPATKPGASAAPAKAATGPGPGTGANERTPGAGPGTGANERTLGAGPGSASSGMVTSKPAEAKTKANEAIQKGDARDRAGAGGESATPAAGSAQAGSAKGGN